MGLSFIGEDGVGGGDVGCDGGPRVGGRENGVGGGDVGCGGGPRVGGRENTRPGLSSRPEGEGRGIPSFRETLRSRTRILCEKETQRSLPKSPRFT